ncbi:family 10 glycosylhydrolase [Romboutsia sp.]|uniref:family 10 glycosylhydrolase n=1 Tax=Romboutsia sp. TaxID=1965302 RepID=UPI002C13E7AD|nr:family 10 glycosylhydrolase [Romboutsia sp.]HSQ87293.1 family 10 glycosylhydrolase [Romboutsia sp.]
MKKIKVLILSLVIIFTTFKLDTFANNDTEMRAAWISTVYNIDWPSTKNNPTEQQNEYVELLDKLKSVGINTVVVQVRPKGDALYKSNINPWSEYLTGTQGKDPGYDPLPFLIDEAHKRGMEFHAWFNPYRVTTSTTDLNTLAENHPARLHPDWVIEHKNGSYQALAYNPGLPEVRKHIVDSVSEVVRNYDIDGVHFDDYFYRDGMNDDETYNMYGNGQDKDSWRRENVNTLLRETKASIKSINSSIEFGVSPSGIWRNISSDPTGSDTRGNESYSSSFADTRAWIKQGLIDYVVPQLYWTIGYSPADYSKLVSWWSNEVKGTNVDLYIGQGIYRQGENGDLNIADEIKQQIALNRQYSDVKGSMYFSARDIIRNTNLQNDITELYSINIKQLQGNDRYDTAAKIGQEGWKTGADTVILTNGYSVVDGVTATPLATSNNAPILLVEKGKIPDVTKTELKRLNPKNLIVIGGQSVVEEKVITDAKSILPGVVTKRIGGIDRYETSLLIAKEISTLVPINKVYVTGGYGEADSLSIASKAGEEKQPIILAQKESITNDIYNWLKSKNLEDAYFIGGSQVLSDKVIEKINTVTSKSVLNNRVYGNDRQETNAKVIEKFYPNSTYNSVLVTKSNPLVDALTAGPLAAKINSPIVILGSGVSPLQNSILQTKSTGLVYQVGGEINQTAFNKIIDLLK